MNDLLIPNVGPIQSRPDVGAGSIDRKSEGPDFEKVLKGTLAEKAAPASPAIGASSLKFSAHALNRIRDRSIPMGQEQLQKLEKAVDTAAAKGAKDSLILSSDAAFIVSVKNKTVVTVLDRNAMNGNVFTNIDSTVLI